MLQPASVVKFCFISLSAKHREESLQMTTLSVGLAGHPDDVLELESCLKFGRQVEG